MTKRIYLTGLVCLTGLIVFFWVSSISAEISTPVNLDFKSADLRDVFRMLAEIAEVNLITDPMVEGEITLSLKDVPFSDAIELITLINDLDYQWIGNTLLIAEPEEIQKKFSMSLATFSIQYAELDKIKVIMESLLSKALVAVDERTRTLVVNGAREDIQRAESMLMVLDAPTPQVFLQVQIIELSSSGLQKYGAKQKNLAELQLDAAGDRLAIDLALTLPQFLQYLTEAGLAKTLANPGLITVDGQTSKLLIGYKVPVEAQEEIDGQIKTVVRYVDAGIKLEFTPRITSDKMITLHIKPQISSFGESLTQGYPLIRSREFETVVRIHDGETFVLGGLIREEDRVSVEKVPFLSEIPLLNALFKYDERSQQSTEIVILITPQIIYPGERYPLIKKSSPRDSVTQSIQRSAVLQRELRPH